MGFSTLQLRSPAGLRRSVSIPRRDFWVFQRGSQRRRRRNRRVSIPRRDFWVFQLERHAKDLISRHDGFNP
ncbi:hypothetical protein CKA32_005586 [Geitlerinema sp. FC II]|nr:hypothetical protein CKA32_005586 [Geitlerinema sp. FC II]